MLPNYISLWEKVNFSLKMYICIKFWVFHQEVYNDLLMKYFEKVWLLKKWSKLPLIYL